MTSLAPPSDYTLLHTNDRHTTGRQYRAGVQLEQPVVDSKAMA